LGTKVAGREKLHDGGVRDAAIDDLGGSDPAADPQGGGADRRTQVVA
jgi:hypothetical protein